MVPLLVQITIFLISSIVSHRVSGLPRPNLCSNKASDIVFAVDSSFSIRPIEFTEQLNFLTAVMDQLPLGPEQFKVGVLKFASEVKLEIKFDQFKSKWGLRKAIRDIQHLEGGTNTQEALRFVRTKMFTEEFGARPSARKQLVIITDGLSTNKSATMNEAAIAKGQGIEIFVIAVAIALHEDHEIKSMASEPKDEHIFKVGDFNALAAIASSVSGAACDGFYGDQPASRQDESIPREIIPQPLKKTSILPACKGGISEVLFLLDSSTSMYINDYKELVAFTRNVTECLDIANDRIRVGVLAYSDRPVTLFRLSDEQSQENLHNVLVKAPYVTGRTDTAFVLKYARTRGFSQARPHVARIIVLLTDGESRDKQATLKEAKAIHSAGIGLLIVGIGNATKEDMRSLSSDPASDRFVFHMQDTHKRFTVPMLLSETTCKEAVKLAETPPSEKCPGQLSDVIFVYDSSALNRQHNNLVIRTISSLTASSRLNNPGYLRLGVIRDASDRSTNLDQSVPDIELSGDWTRSPEFRRRLDPRSRAKLAAASSLLARVRRYYFPADQWSLPQHKRRRRLIVLFLDSPVTSKYDAYNEARMLRKHSDVEIAVVVLGKNFSERQATEIASNPNSTYVIRARRKGKGRLKRIEEKIIKLLCNKTPHLK